MNLPPDLSLSQGSLQDFVDCRRRFYLRYLLRLSWPGIESEPVLENEKFIQQGKAFHLMAYQHALGIPAERLAALTSSAELAEWWGNFSERRGLPELAGAESDQTSFSEVFLDTWVEGVNLTARYDLLLLQPDGRATIYDWKTSRYRSRSAWLASRLQTRVYPYLLACAGGHLHSGYGAVQAGGSLSAEGLNPQDFAINPDKIEMVYWFAGFPDQPERIRYSASQHKADGLYLSNLVRSIRGMEAADFVMTENERDCRYCVYRSHCGRGVGAGRLDDTNQSTPEVEIEFPIDLEQIDEIEY